MSTSSIRLLGLALVPSLFLLQTLVQNCATPALAVRIMSFRHRVGRASGENLEQKIDPKDLVSNVKMSGSGRLELVMLVWTLKKSVLHDQQEESSFCYAGRFVMRSRHQEGF